MARPASRLDDARLDYYRLDPEGAQLLRQALAESLLRELARAVHGDAEAAHAAPHRRDGDDPPAARLAHVRDDRLRDRDRAEHVGLEELSDLFLRAVLGGSAQ